VSEIHLSESQLRQAVKILWNKNHIGPDGLRCDDDDVHEYLAEDGIINDANDDWLSDDSIDKLRTVRITPVITWGQK